MTARLIKCSPRPGLEVGIVEVPRDAHSINLADFGFGLNRTLYYTVGTDDNLNSPNVKTTKSISLYGNLTFLFTSKGATEEQARGIVEDILAPFSDDILGYEDYQSIGFLIKDTALESLNSLLRSLGLDPSSNFAILKIN